MADHIVPVPTSDWRDSWDCEQELSNGKHRPGIFLLKFIEHAAIGAGVEIGISQAAGGSQKYVAGLLAAGTVAGFKEGSDARSGRDSKKQAAWHAFSILVGAGIAAGLKH